MVSVPGSIDFRQTAVSEEAKSVSGSIRLGNALLKSNEDRYHAHELSIESNYLILTNR